MKGKVKVLTLSAMLLALNFSADAQEAKRIPRVGILFGASPSANAGRVEAFRGGLQELGYIDGKNIVIEVRYADGKLDRLPALTAELFRLNVELIVTAGPAVTRPVKEATNTIPIVMAFDSDPVGSGFVASLARPGGNITGLSSLSPELTGKRLELLKETVSKLSRVAVLGNPGNAATALNFKEAEVAARAYGLQVQSLEVRGPNDLDSAFSTMIKRRTDALLPLGDSVVVFHRDRIIQFATKNRLPGTYPNSEWADAGGLMAYGPDILDSFRRAATYVDKILKGAKPADLPVEQPMKFEFVINLKTAKQIGLTIPPNVLARADRVIK
jgi:putative tryptophan/tyrosine transport system substrate-binding protein